MHGWDIQEDNEDKNFLTQQILNIDKTLQI